MDRRTQLDGCRAQPDLREIVDSFAHGFSYRAETLIRISDPPILGINPLFYPFVKTRPRPVARRIRISMFDRIEMDVVGMAFEVVFIPDQVFPKARLQDTALTLPFSPSGDSTLFIS